MLLGPTFGWRISFRRAASDGPLVTVGGLELRVQKGGLLLRGPAASREVNSTLVADRAWHSVTLLWSGLEVSVYRDGALAIAARLKAPLHLPGMGHGTEIRDERTGTEPAVIVFGPIHGIIDNLRMGTSLSATSRPGEAL